MKPITGYILARNRETNPDKQPDIDSTEWCPTHEDAVIALKYNKRKWSVLDYRIFKIEEVISSETADQPPVPSEPSEG